MKTANTTEVTKIQYREPGIGAIEYAKEFTYGLDRAEALSIIKSLLKGDLHDQTDKRVKRCGYCGYYFRDGKANKRRVCCDECKAAKDALSRPARRKKQSQREGKAPRELKEPNPRLRYASMLEYPFYADIDYYLRNVSWHREIPMEDETLDFLNGGFVQKKPTENVRVRYHLAKVSRKAADVFTKKMSAQAIEEYLLKRHGEKKLAEERRRASTLRKWMR